MSFQVGAFDNKSERKHKTGFLYGVLGIFLYGRVNV